MATIGEADPLSPPYLRLIVRGGFEREQTVSVRMDTGFDLTLALPHSIIAALGLEYVGERFLIVATNEEQAFSEYRARVLWNGFERPIRVLAKPGDALAGVALFHGCRVCVEFIDGGGIEIAEIV